MRAAYPERVIATILVIGSERQRIGITELIASGTLTVMVEAGGGGGGW